MAIKPQIKLFFGITALLSSCATTNNWQEDDIYSMKEAAVPIETDITDETDYSAYVYKKSLEDKKTIYSNNTSNIRREPLAWRNSPMHVAFYGMSINSFYGIGTRWYISPFGDIVFLDYYDPFMGSQFGYPYSSFGNPYNYGSFGNYSNYGSWSGNATSSSIINRPRGAIGGMGGVTSRPKNGTGNPTAAYSVKKPTTTTVGQTRKPVSNLATVGRTSSGSPVLSSRQTSSVSRPAVSSSTRTNSGSVATPGRTVSSSGRVSSSSTRTSSSSTPTRSSSGANSGRSSSGSGSVSKSPGRR